MFFEVEHEFYLSKRIDDSSFLNLAVTVLCLDPWMENKRLKENLDWTFWVVVFKSQIKTKCRSVIPATFNTILATPHFKVI